LKWKIARHPGRVSLRLCCDKIGVDRKGLLSCRLPSSSDAPAVVTGGSFFSWGTKFRYSGRTERELLEDTVPRREEPAINRAGSLRRKAASVPATPSTPVDLADLREYFPNLIGSHTCVHNMTLVYLCTRT